MSDELTDLRRAVLWARALVRRLERVEHGGRSDWEPLSELKIASEQADLVKYYVDQVIAAWS